MKLQACYHREGAWVKSIIIGGGVVVGYYCAVSVWSEDVMVASVVSLVSVLGVTVSVVSVVSVASVVSVVSVVSIVVVGGGGGTVVGGVLVVSVSVVGGGGGTVVGGVLVGSGSFSKSTSRLGVELVASPPSSSWLLSALFGVSSLTGCCVTSVAVVVGVVSTGVSVTIALSSSFSVTAESFSLVVVVGVFSVVVTAVVSVVVAVVSAVAVVVVAVSLLVTSGGGSAFSFVTVGSVGSVGLLFVLSSGGGGSATLRLGRFSNFSGCFSHNKSGLANAASSVLPGVGVSESLLFFTGGLATCVIFRSHLL